MSFIILHPQARRGTESPAYRAFRRRTGELIRDNRRLEFLQTLERLGAELTDWEQGFLQGVLARARRRQYHYEFSRRERAVVDSLQQTHGSHLN